MARERDAGPWQTHAQLDVVLELVFAWLEGRELARAGATCGAWHAAAHLARAWRRLLCARAVGADRAVRALAQLYGGACPWRSLLMAAEAPWRRVARLAPSPPPPARLAAAALARAGDLLALAAEDCSFTVWAREQGRWVQAGAGSVAALGWSGVTSAEWAPDAPHLLLAGSVPLSAQRGALAVLQPVTAGSWSAWRVVSRASGGGGCWAGSSFLSLELRRLSAPEHAPHFATDVWLNAATQETDDEFAGVAARVLCVYNEARAIITQVVCVDVPLDGRAAREWAEAEAAARAQDAAGDVPAADVHLEEQAPGEAYYRTTYDRGRDKRPGSQTPWVRVVVLACGGVLCVHALSRDAPPPLRVRGALRERVEARRARKLQEAEAAAAAGEEAPAAPEPSEAELRTRCDAPAARLRTSAHVLGLAVHNNGRAVWASVGGGAVCAALPGLLVLRAVRVAPGPGLPHYLRPGANDEYFGSPVGGSGCDAAVWGAAPGAGALLRPPDDRAPALALLLARGHAPGHAATPTALLLTEVALHVFQCTAPRARPPPCATTCHADDRSVDDNSADDNSVDDNSVDDNSVDDNSVDDNSVDDNTADDRSVDDNSVDDNSVDDNSVDDSSTDDCSEAAPGCDHCCCDDDQ